MRKSRWLLEFSPDTLNLYSPVRMKNGSLNDLVNFSCMVKFSKQYLDCKRLCEYCRGTFYVRNFTTSDTGRGDKNM